MNYIKAIDYFSAPVKIQFNHKSSFKSGLGGIFTLIVIGIMNEKEVRNKNILNILFYLLIYLAIYPLIMITSLTKLIRGKYSW
mgnify:CR=1 FL=1